jgi:hypothetical protein
MLETFLKVLIVVNFLTTIFVLAYVAKRQRDYCINKDVVIAKQEQKIKALFAENIEAENKARVAANFGDDFIAQPVHGEQKPVRINLTTLDKEKSNSVAD